MTNELVAFVDTETTGLDPAVHAAWEVALILRDDEGVEVERVWQLPVDLGKADAVALSVGRFYERRVPSAYSDKYLLPANDDEAVQRIDQAVLGTGPWVVPRDSMDDFAAYFAELTHGAHLVGCNPAFDDAFLKQLLRRNGACPGWSYHLVDVEALIAGLMGQQPPWKSTDLSRLVGVDPDNFDRHTALGDARWVAAQFDAVMAKAGQRSALQDAMDGARA